MSISQNITQEKAALIVKLFDQGMPKHAIAVEAKLGTRAVAAVLVLAGRTRKYKPGVKLGYGSACGDVIAYDVSRITLVGFSREQAERRMRRFGEHRCEVRP